MTLLEAPQLEYEIGDRVLINCCCSGKVEGVVIGVFNLNDDPATKYIIRVDDPDYPHEEVRDALLMQPISERAPMPYDHLPKPRLA